MHKFNTKFITELSEDPTIKSRFTRKEISSQLGGIISPRTLANLDSKGMGCPEKELICGKIVYLKQPFLIWLDNRIYQQMNKNN